MKLFIHPVFFLAVAVAVYYSAATFMVALVLAVFIHELCHAIGASFFGISPTRLSILPFGGAINIDCVFLSAKQKNIVLLAGPAGNFIAAVIFGILVWLFPVIFIYLEYLTVANFVTGLMNLLPIATLDGGKLLANYIGERPILWFSNIIFVALLSFSLYTFNFFISFFAIMMLLSVNFPHRSVFSSKLHAKTGSIVEYAVNADQTLFAVYKMVHKTRPTKFIVADRNNRAFYENDLEKWLMRYPADTRLFLCLAN